MSVASSANPRRSARSVVIRLWGRRGEFVAHLGLLLRVVWIGFLATRVA